MTLTRGVTLPPATAVGGGLLAQARPLPDGWTRGVEFASEVCLIAGSHQFCADSPTEKQFQGAETSAFEPMGVEVSVVCTTLTAVEDRLARARTALGVVAEHNLGVEVATGAVTSNPSLADATASGSGADATEALAIIEGLIAENLMGHLAFVHVAPQRLTELVAAQALYRDPLGTWRTATGHVVIASPGYADTIEDEIVATPEMFAELGEPEQVRMVDRKDNRQLAVFETPALAVFDPCFNVSVAITDSP